jgi:hypothetical protein
MKRLRFVLIVLLVIGFAALFAFVISPRHDPRLERLIGWHTRLGNPREAAIEREVVEAELASYGPELIPALRQELNSGSLCRTKLAIWIESKSARFVARYIAQKRFDSERRRELAVLCLGRIGPPASAVLPDLKRLTTTGGQLGLSAETALAMVARQDLAIQTNAVAALNSTSQPRRHFFMLHANEIWPGRTDLFINGLKDEDQSVRAAAAEAISRAGSRCSNVTSLLIPMLADRSVIVRPKAALALGLVAPDFAETAIASMIDQRKTNFAWTGDCAYVLYQAAGPKAKAAIPALESDLSETNMLVFHGDAAAALWRITGKMSPAIADGLNTGLRVGVQRTQIRCLRIVKEIGPAAAGTIPDLRGMTNHPLVLIRRLASEALESVEHTGQSSQINRLNAP